MAKMNRSARSVARRGSPRLAPGAAQEGAHNRGMKETKPVNRPTTRPGRTSEMSHPPRAIRPDYRGSGKLEGKIALVTGGDSGIGRSVAVHFAREGADVAIVYLEERDDAHATCDMIEREGRRCFSLQGDLAREDFCRRAIERVVREMGGLDILVNNAAEQRPQPTIGDISVQQLERTFRTNLFAMFHLTKAALPHLQKRPGACIINTSSITAYQGSAGLLDYSATKGAITAFTRALSQSLVKVGIRVNEVAPGPIWTPLIPSTFPPDKVESFGKDTPMGRPGQPEEVAPAYVYLACQDASYTTGETIHVNGGEFVSG